jgi:hypothetical protein
MDAKVVIGVCGFLVALCSFWWNWRRSRKNVSFWITVNPVVQRTKDLHGSIVVLYDAGGGDKPVEVADVYTSRLTIKNIGYQEIAKSDFDVPLIFTVPPPTKILSAAIGDCDPESLVAHVTFELSSTLQQFRIEPMLLNRSDMISFSLVLSGVQDARGFCDNVTCDGRVKGIRQIMNRYETSRTANKADKFIYGFGFLSTVGFLSNFVHDAVMRWLMIVVAFAAITVQIVAVIVKLRALRRRRNRAS